MAIHPKKLFLIDSIGALFSAFLLGIVLVRLENHFGMPKSVLHVLSFIACLFCIYSFTSYLLIKKNWKVYLKIIAFANLAYCCLTIGLTLWLNKDLTNLGWIYFLSEVAVIIMLAMIELKTASNWIDSAV